jgi:cytochrome c-type biogenesis protein CcmH
MARIDGVVDIDPQLRAMAKPGMALFIFAKAAASPGPPLAVWRTTVDRWPLRFSLDDTRAMLPQRKLSDFDAVIVEARISASGQPLAHEGDLQGSSGTVNPRKNRTVSLLIGSVNGK